MDAKAKDTFGRTVLIYAAISGNIEVFKLLLERGVEARAKDIFGKTALDYAEYGENEEIIELLRNAGGR